MCGIAGIYNSKEQVSPETVKTMINSFNYRGPDDEGVFFENNIALGHKRLAIIDLSKDGHQPMFSSDNRYVIVFNGEIFNYKELKQELSEYNFTSKSDTEVLLAAYQKWGVNCLPKLRGMFAFAIWDKQTEELFIARDHIGVKPLYYYKTDNELLFSSEIRGLLASGKIPKKLDKNSLTDYLQFQTVHAPNTLVKNVKMLEAGHFLTLKKNELTINKYYSSFDVERKTEDSLKVTQQKIGDLLDQAVNRRLVSDVPLGAFLSGGIDSSILVGLASKQIKNLNTFTISFADKKYSEAKYAEIVAKKFNTNHTTLQLSPEEFLEDLPNAIIAIDHPSGDGPNSYTVSKVTKAAGITVALSGVGGDELFCGYDVFKNMHKVEQNKLALNLIPEKLRYFTANALKIAKKDVQGKKFAEFLSNKKIDFASTYRLDRQIYFDDEITKLMGTKPIQNMVFEIAKSKISSNKSLTNTSKMELNTYMQNVLLRDTDQMSMANSLEVRVPFLDVDLVNYVLSVSDSFKYPTTPKKLLIDSVANLLPPEIVNREKMGFSFPWDTWLRNELKSFCENAIINLSKRDEFVEKEIISIWNRFLLGDKTVNWIRIWILVVLEKWISKNIDS